MPKSQWSLRISPETRQTVTREAKDERGLERSFDNKKVVETAIVIRATVISANTKNRRCGNVCRKDMVHAISIAITAETIPPKDWVNHSAGTREIRASAAKSRNFLLCKKNVSPSARTATGPSVIAKWFGDKNIPPSLPSHVINASRANPKYAVSDSSATAAADSIIETNNQCVICHLSLII